jgi:starvation-inducible DNA-binding protein
VSTKPNGEDVIVTAQFHIPITAADREVAAELQGMLVDLIDLALIGKHAHWNVEGPHFRSVHRELDELVDTWRELSDDVAERAVVLGAAPDGQSEAIAGSTKVEPLPGGHLADDEVIWLVSDRLEQVAARARERLARVADLDPVGEDLLIGVAAALEKQLWMLRAQRADR